MNTCFILLTRMMMFGGLRCVELPGSGALTPTNVIRTRAASGHLGNLGWRGHIIILFINSLVNHVIQLSSHDAVAIISVHAGVIILLNSGQLLELDRNRIITPLRTVLST